jgi:hypothetical protein
MYRFGGHGVNVQLSSMRSTGDVCWLKGNSYVRVQVPDHRVEGDETRVHRNLAGEEFYIISVNGIGEIRWPVNSGYDLVQPENQVVAAYFGVVGSKCRTCHEQQAELGGFCSACAGGEL